MPAESAAKTFILIHYARLVRAGRLDPTRRVRLGPDLRPMGTGGLGHAEGTPEGADVDRPGVGAMLYWK
jgi:hypothetical protein